MEADGFRRQRAAEEPMHPPGARKSIDQRRPRRGSRRAGKPDRGRGVRGAGERDHNPRPASSRRDRDTTRSSPRLAVETGCCPDQATPSRYHASPDRCGYPCRPPSARFPTAARHIQGAPRGRSGDCAPGVCGAVVRVVSAAPPRGRRTCTCGSRFDRRRHGRRRRHPPQRCSDNVLPRG
jgi:hypothetical protein